MPMVLKVLQILFDRWFVNKVHEAPEGLDISYTNPDELNKQKSKAQRQADIDNMIQKLLDEREKLG